MAEIEEKKAFTTFFRFGKDLITLNGRSALRALKALNAEN
jgi:hypothetical protein